MKGFSETKILIGTVLAGLTASACCAGPLVLISMGFSGIWISKLTALEPYRPIFVALTLILLFLAFQGIYQPAEKCTPETVCALPKTRRLYKALFWMVALFALVSLFSSQLIVFMFGE